MTLQLEHLTDMTPEDRDDLITIYTHGPHCERRIPGMPEMAEDATRLIRNVQDRDAASFYAGRFNSRLIVAAVALVKEGTAQIDSICVRQSSAGRDVEGRFIRRLLDALSSTENEITLHLPQDSASQIEVVEPEGFEMERESAGTLRFRRLHAPDGAVPKEAADPEGRSAT